MQLLLVRVINTRLGKLRVLEFGAEAGRAGAPVKRLSWFIGIEFAPSMIDDG